MLLKLNAADHGRILNDGTGLSGKVYAGTKGISVHFRYRYRFQGEPREMPLGAWPKIALDAIRANFEETKLRVERDGDPAGQKKAVAQKIQIEQAQLEQQQELAEQQREQAEQQLTVHAMFEDWHPEAMIDNTPQGAQQVRRMFELHLLPQVGTLRVLDTKPPDTTRSAAIAAVREGHAMAMQIMEIRHSLQRWAECGKGIARTEAQRALAQDDDEGGGRWYKAGGKP
ncbi:Arm DNA-binding domain-containing protein [Paraburkholderia phytofirmans]|uniref:Arm DNA-binding domain-containing protein n=1 Tax=Paraburkholderia phytofirmans TaxID=261302 RepID=UPI0038BC0669